MSNQFIYANGFTIANARKMCKFIFGDFYHKVEKNDEQLRFDIYLKDKVRSGNEILTIENDCMDLDYFKSYWNGINVNNPPFNVMVIGIKF